MQVINFHPTSLKNRIAKASTENEIDQLLAEGKGYQFASLNTRGKWKKVAKLRIEELNQKTETKMDKPAEVPVLETDEKEHLKAKERNVPRRRGRPPKQEKSN